MTLSQCLTRRNNNFDLLRLIAACAVIVGHAHALVPNDASPDAVLSLLGFDYSGSLAVKFFFFLSGLVVTNSLIEKPPGDFCYGVYLYGFPLQQLMVESFPLWNAHQNQAASLAAALIAGACSWYLVERPAIRLGRRLVAPSKAPACPNARLRVPRITVRKPLPRRVTQITRVPSDVWRV